MARKGAQCSEDSPGEQVAGKVNEHLPETALSLASWDPGEVRLTKTLGCLAHARRSAPCSCVPHRPFRPGPSEGGAGSSPLCRWAKCGFKAEVDFPRFCFKVCLEFYLSEAGTEWGSGAAEGGPAAGALPSPLLALTSSDPRNRPALGALVPFYE